MARLDLAVFQVKQYPQLYRGSLFSMEGGRFARTDLRVFREVVGHRRIGIVKLQCLDNTRYLLLSDDLLELSQVQIQGRHFGNFVFPSPTGLCIDDHMLQRWVFKLVTKVLGLGDKDLYVTR